MLHYAGTHVACNTTSRMQQQFKKSISNKATSNKTTKKQAKPKQSQNK
jgi:hypothetical protein